MELVSAGTSAAKIQELKGLMIRRPIDHRRGPTEDRISKLSVYGGQQMHGAKIKIGEVRQALNYCVRKQREGRKFSQGNYLMG